MAAFIDCRTKHRLPLNEELVLSLLQDGNCSDLDLDDADDEFFASQLESEDLVANEEPCEADPTPPRKGGKQRKTNTIGVQDTDEGGPSTSQKHNIKVKVIQRPRIWKKTNFIDRPHNYTGHPEPIVIRSPIDYFNDYYNDDFFELMSTCTNMYHMRKTGDILKTTKQEMKKLYGIHLMMGILSYPRIAMYWRQKIKIEMIASVMTRDRLMALRNNLHVVETDSPPIQDTVNALWKVQPVINAVQNGCKKILRTPGRYSIDEQMIPFTEALDRARLARERREAEQRKRLDELRAHAAAAQAQREKRDEDRRRRQAEQRAKDDDRRLQVEERKRAIWEASISRREALLQRERDRSERLERARAARSAPRPAFAFGSSTPRLLEPVDSAGFFWAARSTNPIDQMNFFESLAASTTNVMFASAPLTRRASALQLDTSDTDNKDEPDRSPQPVWSSVARRRTDLVPTLPARPGRAYSMTRLDKLPGQRPIHSSSPSMHHLNIRQPRSGDTTPGSRPGSAMSNSVVRRASSAPRKPRPASIAGTGVNTPRGADTSASSAATTPSVSRDASTVVIRAATTPRRPRPLSLHAPHAQHPPAGKPAGPLGPGEGKPPLHRKPKPSKDHDKSGKSLSASPGRALSPSPSPRTRPGGPGAATAAGGAAGQTDAPDEVSDKSQVSAIEVTQKLEALQIGDSQQSSEIKESLVNITETNHEQKVQQNKEEKQVDVQKPEKEKEDKIEKEKEKIEKEKEDKIETEKEEKREKEERKEPSQEKTEENEMTASMSSRRITTEEEAKAALAERRRRAREELERQAELERRRLQREAEEEAERQRQEEERQRREEEEARELAALQRKMEEEKLRKAIEAQQQLEREEAARRAREEEERAARAREEGERRRAAEEQERARREEAEREERERLARKQRVEAIMARTRLKKQAEEDKKQQEMKTQQNQPASETTTQNNTAEQDNAAVTNAAQNNSAVISNAVESAAPIANIQNSAVNAVESSNVSHDAVNNLNQESAVTNDIVNEQNNAAVTSSAPVDSSAVVISTPVENLTVVSNSEHVENSAVESVSDNSNGNVQTGDLLQLAASQPDAPQETQAPASNNGNVTADLLGLVQQHETKDKPDEQPPKQIDNPTLDTNNGNVGRISANFIQSERRDDFAAHNGHKHAHSAHPLTLQNAI
ncbi:unnamed protein product [Euphydryas editha]|uniref:PiggyBac transposable element-derived protein domain-containing protein n=1 Tax=Euphydryas editha TaxID=104508 RepID=A0AAU9UAD4_EUPED|nr:unnamed protein product [Euphydryas editha]